MKLPGFFIHRPVFSSILNLMIMVVGLISLMNISLREYPDIDIPKLQVQTIYPNASPELVESRVTDPLEDSLASVSGLDSISSQSHSNRSEISLSFKPGTPVDAKIVEVRDAIEKVRAQFPDEVQTPVINKSGENDGPPFIGISVVSGFLKPQDLTHYVNLNFKNLFRSIPGVASAEIWSQGFAMGITLDPKKLYGLGLDIADVTSALKGKSMPFSGGKLHKEVPITVNTELRTEDDFRNLIIKLQGGSGAPILLDHVATIKLIEDDSSFRIRVNGKSGSLIAIKLNSDANPLEVSKEIHTIVDSLQDTLPDGMEVSVSLDNANFIRSSLSNIQKSILEATVLVLIIILVFIRNFRAALIPLLTIPISLVGVLGLFYALGLSINILTLLAIILAIGLVVDDAIVVLENSQRHIEEGASVFEAAIKGSQEIGFAVVAMTLTLASVYAPIAFLEGITGALFKEFAIALAGAVLISGVVALTLSPMLCSRILKPVQDNQLSGIDRFMSSLMSRYKASLSFMLEKSAFVFAGLGLAVFALGGLFYILPEERAPAEDRGLVGLYAPPIPGKGIEVMDSLGQIFNKEMADTPEAIQFLTFVGSWGASVAMPLKPWAERSRSASQVRDGLQAIANNIPSAQVYAWDWNSGLPGTEISLDGDIEFVLQTSKSYGDLYKEGARLVRSLNEGGRIKWARQRLLLTSPGYDVKIKTFQQSLLGISDSKMAKAIEVSAFQDKNQTFMRDGLNYPIVVKTTNDPDNLSEIYVMNQERKPVSLSAIADLVFVARPNALTHYNQMRSTNVNISPLEGQKIGEIINIVKEYQKESLGKGFSIEWVGATKSSLEGASKSTLLLILAIVFIFAILAIQFESLIDPLMIIVTVPLAAIGALLLMWLCGVSLNIYSKIGLVTLVGLITKHGILLVEMANRQREKGLSLQEAAIKAASLRLRPILMTTGAMVFGVLPLAFSSGAGSEARQAIGLVLLGGLVFGTFMTLFVIPVVYTLKEHWAKN